MLLLVEPMCLSFYRKSTCDGYHRLLAESAGTHGEPQLVEVGKYSFMWVHLYCFVASALCEVFYKCRMFELSRIFEITRVPVYFVAVYQAHYFGLNFLQTEGY